MAELGVTLEINNLNKKEQKRLLFKSCQNGQRDIVESLFSKGVSPDVKDKDRRTPLILSSMAGHEDIVALILDHGVDVKKRNSSKAFMKACESGHDKVVKLLVDRGVNITYTDIEEKTALMHACIGGHDKVVEILMEHLTDLDLNERDCEGATALMCSCINGHEKVVELLIKRVSNLNIKYDEGTTALMCACMNGHEKVVRLLIEKMSDLDEIDYEGRSPLIWACINGHDKVLEILLEHEADPNASDDEGTTALMFASMFGHDKVVEILMKHVSDLNETCGEGTTAWMWTCVMGHDSVLKMLIEHVCASDLNEREYKDRTALFWACKEGHDKVLKLLIEKGVDVDVRNGEGATPLIEVCKGGYVGIAELLIEKGADVNAGDKDGTMPLMAACSNKHEMKKKVCDNSSHAETVKLLLRHGASVDKQDIKHGWSAAMIAIRTDKVDCLQILMPANPDLDLVDKEGKTVFSHAMEKSNTECLAILLEDGKLLTDGKLKPVHKNSNIPFITKEPLMMAFEYGLFEWEWCPLSLFRILTQAALKSKLSPGKIRYDTNTYLPPLVVALLINDRVLTDTFIKRLFYTPEDYTILCNDMDIRGRIENIDVMEKLTLQPPSLQTWCYWTVSKCISYFPVNKRCERVDSLPIPDRFKRRLNFE